MDSTAVVETSSACQDCPEFQEKYRELLNNLNALQTNLKDAVTDLHALQINLKGAVTVISSANETTDRVSIKLGQMQKDLYSIGDFVRAELHQMYFDEVKGRDVFGTKELFESILLESNIPAVHAMKAVNKEFNETISNPSNALGIKLFLKADKKDSTFRTAFGVGNQLVASLTVEKASQGIVATFLLNEDGGIPSINAPWMKMLICQPGITHMAIHKLCKDCGAKSALPFLKIVAKDGFTVEHVHNCAKAVADVPAYCTKCAIRDPRHLAALLSGGTPTTKLKGIKLQSYKGEAESGSEWKKDWKQI